MIGRNSPQRLKQQNTVTSSTMYFLYLVLSPSCIKKKSTATFSHFHPHYYMYRSSKKWVELYANKGRFSFWTRAKWNYGLVTGLTLPRGPRNIKDESPRTNKKKCPGEWHLPKSEQEYVCWIWSSSSLALAAFDSTTLLSQQRYGGTKKARVHVCWIWGPAAAMYNARGRTPCP